MSDTLTNCASLAAAGPAAHSRGTGNNAEPRLRPTWPVLLTVIAGLVVLAIAEAAIARDFHSNPWLLSWIPATCCVTNDCCWEIGERELTPLPNDAWQVVSTGQIRKRTDWSPDGKFYRCACDYDLASRHWVRHQGANTRCIFVPMRSAGRNESPARTAKLQTAMR